MKSKCTTIVKVITALVLAVLMMVGSVSNVVGAVIEQASFDGGSVLAASAEKGLEIAENASVSDKADADAPDLSGFEENEIVRGMKNDLAALGAGMNLAATGLDSGDGIHLGIGTTATTWHGMGDDDYQFTLNATTTIYFTFSVSGGNFGRGNQGNPGSDSEEDWTWHAIKNDSTQFQSTLPAGTYKFKLKGIQSGNANCLEYQFWCTSGGSTPSGDAKYYLYGDQFGGWSWTDTDAGWESALTRMDYDSSTGYYYKAHHVPLSGNDFYRVGKRENNTSTHYGMTSDTQVVLNGDKVTSNSGWNKSFWLRTSSNAAISDKDVIVWFDPTNSQTWVKSATTPTAASLSISASPSELTAVDQTSTITVTATNIASGVTNLTYRIYDRANNNVVDSTDVTNGATSVTFTVTPNAQAKSYYASVFETNDDQHTTYSEVWTATDAVITNSAEDYVPTYTVTFDSNDSSYGTVTAKSTYKGVTTTISSSDPVKEGASVTFTATPTTGNVFTSWNEFDTTSNSVTRVIRAATTATGNFGPKGYKVLAGSDSTNNMKELSNGTYISTVTYNHGAWFEIVRNATGKTTVASADHQGVTTGTKYKVTSWQDGTTWRGTYIFKIYEDIGDGYYIVYDPATEEVWITKDPDDLYAVTVVAKDGTIRYGYEDLDDYTQEFGDTTVELVSPASITGTVDNDAYDGMAVAYNLSANDVRNGVTLKIKTQTKETYVNQGYYVKGFVVTGYEKSFSVLWPDNAADAAKVENGYNEFELTLPSYPDKKIEITPVYWVQETKPGDNVRFYVESFAGDVYKEWGGNLAINAYSTSGPILGEYPGQPMINYNGRYVVDIPRANLQGITLNNYVWDRVHSNLFIGTSGIDNPTTSNGYLQKIQGANKQTYDFNDFIKIKETLENDLDEENNDEDIIFSFRYKYDTSHNTLDTSNHGKLTYYKDSDAAGKDPVVTVDTNYDYEDQASTLDPNLSIYQWENLTDLYKNRVDILGNKVDTTQADGTPTNPKAAYTNPVRIVSNGYDFNAAGKYATAWAVYVPVDSSNNLAPNGSYDHYQLVEVFGGQGKVKQENGSWVGKWGSSSYLVDYDYYESLHDKYDANSHYGSSSSFVYDLAHMPTVISYEYSVNSNKSNLNLEQAGNQATDGNPGLRSDGRWYATSSKQFLTAHTIIEYAEKDQEDLYHRDFYQEGGIDFHDETNYNKTLNTGLSTGIKAYFDNDDSDDGVNSETGVAYENTPGHTEAYSVSDGEHKFKLRTVGDTSGDYVFKGWYMYTNGVYTFVSDDPSYESEATANDVYVARYYKIPSGNIQITHNLHTDSTGFADCLAKVEVVNATNTDTHVGWVQQEFTSEAIKAGSQYIKSNSNNALKITLKTVPDSVSKLDDFYESIVGEIAEMTISGIGDVTGATVSLDKENNQATVIIPIKSFFNNEEQTIKSLPFFSKVDEQLILTHDLLPAIDDTIAETFIKYEIKDSGETTPFFTSDEVKNGPLTVAPEHLYKNTDRRMVVTLRTTIAQNKFHDFDRFSMKLPDGTYYLFKEGQGGLNGENVHIEENANHTQATITISFPISRLLDNGKLQMNKLQYFSELKTPRFKYSIEYRYDSYVKSYGTQSYTVSGYFDELPGELAEYTKYSTYYNQHLTFNADADSTSYLMSLASSKAPYEDNFRKTFDFSKASIFSQQYNRGAETYEYKVKASADNQSFIATMKFPYKVGEYGVPLNLNGQIASSSDIIYAAPADDLDTTDVTNKEFSVYSGDWIVKSGSRNEKIENYVEPTFIRPALIYQDANGTNHYFQYWSVKTIGSYGASSLEYTRCYDTSFNFTIFQECEITPVYSTVAWDTTKMPNPPSTWDMYERFDPDVNRTADEQNGITIRFMENSRNQYNHNGYGSFYNELNVETSKTTEVAERRRGAADRIYTDFLISYNNVEPNTVLKEKYKDGGKKVGIVIQPVGRVENGETKTESEYMTQFGATVTADLKSAVSNYLQGKGGTFAKAEFDAKELDNKNRIRYYFGIDNKTAKALNTTTLPELDETYSNSHDMIFRAYAYIVDYDETNHTYDWDSLKMNDVPTYYTIYDIGSIQNGGSYPSGN